MEGLLLVGLALVVPVVLLWRSRRGTTSWRESPTAWQSDRNPSKFDFHDSPQQDFAAIAQSRAPKMSREEGHGKDGGG